MTEQELTKLVELISEKLSAKTDRLIELQEEIIEKLNNLSLRDDYDPTEYDLSYQPIR
jgi:hypothetical protein